MLFKSSSFFNVQTLSYIHPSSFRPLGHRFEKWTIAIFDMFGKNERVKVFWTVFVGMAGLVMALMVDR